MRAAEISGDLTTVLVTEEEIRTMADVAADEHVRARGSLVTVDGVTMPGLIARFSATPGEIRGAGRALGADTEAVLAEIDETAPDGV